jgi:hypothetical protein
MKPYCHFKFNAHKSDNQNQHNETLLHIEGARCAFHQQDAHPVV